MVFLHVNAKDKATGKENKIVIKSSGGLSEEEIKKMEDDAELHAEEDKKLRELVDAKNLSEGMIHSIKKTMADHPDKVEKDEKEKIEKAISELEESLKSIIKMILKLKTKYYLKYLKSLVKKYMLTSKLLKHNQKKAVKIRRRQLMPKLLMLNSKK